MALSKETHKEIQELYASGLYTRNQLALKFNCSLRTVAYAINPQSRPQNVYVPRVISTKEKEYQKAYQREYRKRKRQEKLANADKQGIL